MRKVILYSIMMFLFLAGFHVKEGFCEKKAVKRFKEEYNIVQALEKGIIEIEATLKK